jgi:hypothetical protein
MNTSPIPPTEWERHLPGVRAALGPDGHTVDDLLGQVASGEAQLWHRTGALIVTQIVEEGPDMVLHFWVATGELQPLIALSRELLAWGKEQGCSRASLIGRRGWERVLSGEGWEYAHTALGRRL